MSTITQENMLRESLHNIYLAQFTAFKSCPETLKSNDMTRMLTALMGGKYWSWRVVGITPAALEKFKTREGHCRVPKGYVEGGYKFGTWVKTQREKKDNIPSERRQQLDDIGFEWDPLTTQWEEGFAALEMFKAREGHCRVPNEHVEGSYRLGVGFVTGVKKRPP